MHSAYYSRYRDFAFWCTDRHVNESSVGRGRSKPALLSWVHDIKYLACMVYAANNVASLMGSFTKHMWNHMPLWTCHALTLNSITQFIANLGSIFSFAQIQSAWSFGELLGTCGLIQAVGDFSIYECWCHCPTYHAWDYSFLAWILWSCLSLLRDSINLSSHLLSRSIPSLQVCPLILTTIIFFFWHLWGFC